ncbi:dethiobiotin synthase [Streptomyces sp. MJP52]|uniref:dethiobiotin synthase n=1 Tax=Streptomyces sp. MJP52 TaxID=2940555 RepID=UPI0024741604|nr:dethiobiotin synthase [Streptomyces sp. MJP52]MDH6223501.1 dethiobiotin synthetase [Streptomyces sp. MJP52]
MSVIVVSGTGTEIGKTVVTAAVAALAAAAGRSVAVLKPAQTGLAPGEPGDAAEAARLAGGAGARDVGAGGTPGTVGTPGAVTAVELARYPDPLAPATAARRAGMPPVRPEQVAEAAEKLAAGHDLVLVEGAGGLLVRLDERDATLADAAALLGAPVLVVAPAGLGTLNTTALTAEALRSRKLEQLGVVVGSWPRDPDLAARCNLTDLPRAAGAPLLGAVPQGAGALSPRAFREAAADWLSPRLGGRWDAAAFVGAHGAPDGERL